MKLALCRLGPAVVSQAEALRRLLATYHRAQQDGAELIVFPEMLIACTGKSSKHLGLGLRTIKALAAKVSGPPLLLAARSPAGRLHPELPGEIGVYALHEGKAEALTTQNNGSQWLQYQGRRIETFITYNQWSPKLSILERYRDYSRDQALIQHGASLALDFHAEPCPQPPMTAPLHPYWHVVTGKENLVADNGIIQDGTRILAQGQGSEGDAHVVVDISGLTAPDAPCFAQTQEGRLGCELFAENDGLPPQPDSQAKASHCLILGCSSLCPLRIGNRTIHAQMQRTRRQFFSGMMFRQPLGDDEGMLFVFPQPQPVAFHMRNTPSPLSIAFLDAKGVICEILHLKAFDTRTRQAKSMRIQYGLEMRQGWFRAHRLGVGDSVLPAPPLAGSLGQMVFD